MKKRDLFDEIEIRASIIDLWRINCVIFAGLFKGRNVSDEKAFLDETGETIAVENSGLKKLVDLLEDIRMYLIAK